MEKISTEEKWVLEWSHSQQAFHKQLFEDAIASNFSDFSQGQQKDWVVVAVGTREHIDEESRRLGKILIARRSPKKTLEARD
jgi:hypothetical protein